MALKVISARTKGCEHEADIDSNGNCFRNRRLHDMDRRMRKQSGLQEWKLRLQQWQLWSILRFELRLLVAGLRWVGNCRTLLRGLARVWWFWHQIRVSTE